MQSALHIFCPSKLLYPYIVHKPIFPDVCHGVDDFKDPFPRVKTQVESQILVDSLVEVVGDFEVAEHCSFLKTVVFFPTL